MKAMKINVYNHSVTGYTIRSETLNGVEHWVVPVIMMVEGVHDGSAGPILYTVEELGRSPTSWDGIPVVINHPEEGLSANNPNAAEQVVGRIFNTHMDGLKLMAEAWIDIARLQTVSQSAYDYIRDQRALEVSVGVVTEDKEQFGEFNNEEYRAIALHIQPDHLALLPDSVGACSWDDGCGVRINKKGGNINVDNLKTLTSKELLKEGYGIHLISNETGFREIMTNIQQKLDQLDNDIRVHFLEELFDGNFIYRIHSRESGETSYFRRTYAVQPDGSVDFTGDPVQVRKDVTFQTLEAKKLKRTNFKTSKTMKQNKEGTPCEVGDLISNKDTHFAEEDREWLETLEESQLAKLVPKEAKPVEKKDPIVNTEPPKEKTEGEVLVKKDDEGTIRINGKTVEETVIEILGKEKDPEVFIDNFMPEGLKGQMKSGLKMYHDNRSKLIKGITENSKFEDANLKNWKDDDLQNLYDSVVTEAADYSALGGKVSTFSSEQTEEMESMLNFKGKEGGSSNG